MVRGYDKLALDYGMLLDLPFEEGTGLLTRDIAKPHHEDVTLVGPPTWAKWPLSNINLLNFTGAHYLELAAAASIDLDFTSEDYSIAVWINPVDTFTSEMVIGRYELNMSGWEVYLFDLSGVGYLQQRHHHASLAPDVRDGCYSEGWTANTWWLMGISRHGLYPIHYRNGVALPMAYEPTGMQDPDTCNQDLVIATRYTKNGDWYRQYMKRPRIWNRCLEAWEWQFLFECERAIYGV